MWPLNRIISVLQNYWNVLIEILGVQSSCVRIWWLVHWSGWRIWLFWFSSYKGSQGMFDIFFSTKLPVLPAWFWWDRQMTSYLKGITSLPQEPTLFLWRIVDCYHVVIQSPISPCQWSSCFLFLPCTLGASLESSVLTFIVFPTVSRSKGVLLKL